MKFRSAKHYWWESSPKGGVASPPRTLLYPIWEGFPLMKTIFGSLLLLMAVTVTTGCSAKHGPGCHRWGCGVFNKCLGGCGHGCADGGCTDGGCTQPGCNNQGCTGGCGDGQAACGPNCQAGCGPQGHCVGNCAGCGHGLFSGCERCPHCGLGCGLLGKHHKQYTDIGAQNSPSGPPTGTVAYPYYTTRGPRDFFAANPPSIGP